MANPTRLKKSETLEIRLPYPTKLAFMARCRGEGRSASEALRQFIDGHLEERGPARRSSRLGQVIAAALVAAAMGAFAAPSLAKSSPHADFACLDLNGDGGVSAAELARFDADHDGRVSFQEFHAACDATRR